MSTHNIPSGAEIRRISIPFGWKSDVLSGAVSQFSTEKEEEAAKAAEAKAAGDVEAEKPQYNYPIRVKCGVAVTDIEWTTEVTDAKLHTTTTTEVSEFEQFGLEMDHRLDLTYLCLVDSSNSLFG